MLVTFPFKLEHINANKILFCGKITGNVLNPPQADLTKELTLRGEYGQICRTLKSTSEALPIALVIDAVSKEEALYDSLGKVGKLMALAPRAIR